MNVSDRSSPSDERKPLAGVGLANGGKKLRWGKVLALVVPVAVVAVVAVAIFRFMDMDAILGDLARPQLVQAGGQVFYQGKPLANGQVMTQPASGRGSPALGWTDDEGRFTLMTDIRGNYVEGATVGEHRVIVTAHERIATGAAAAPPLLTPSQYASVGSSPLRIDVGPDAAKNQFELVLVGEAPTRTRGSGIGKGKRTAESNSAGEALSAPDASKNTGDSTTKGAGTITERSEVVPEE